MRSSRNTRSSRLRNSDFANGQPPATTVSYAGRGALISALPVALVLAACTTSDAGPDPDETVASESPATPEAEGTSPSPEATAEEEVSETNGPQDEEDVDDASPVDFTDDAQVSDNWEGYILDVGHNTMQVAVDVRHGVHEGYERVVIEYSEDTDLAYRAEYEELSDDPDASPASLVVEIQGTTGGPEAQDLATTEPWRSDAEENAVEAVYPLNPEAGESEVRIGLDQERPFRIHHQEDPTRIVIDLATD